MNIWLDYASNDDNGMCTGKARAIHLEIDGELALELEPTLLYGGVTVHRAPRRFYLGRVALRELGHASWVGNMMWNAVRVSAEDAAKALNYLKRTGWQSLGGLCSISDRWEDGSLTAKDIAAEEQEEQ